MERGKGSPFAITFTGGGVKKAWIAPWAAGYRRCVPLAGAVGPSHQRCPGAGPGRAGQDTNRPLRPIGSHWRYLAAIGGCWRSLADRMVGKIMKTNFHGYGKNSLAARWYLGGARGTCGISAGRLSNVSAIRGLINTKFLNKAEVVSFQSFPRSVVPSFRRSRLSSAKKN